MADGVAFAQAIETMLRALPSTPQGVFKVTDPGNLSLQIASLAANTYEPDIELREEAQHAAENERGLVANERDALRNDVDALRLAVANAHAALTVSDSAGALTILAQHV